MPLTNSPPGYKEQKKYSLTTPPLGHNEEAANDKGFVVETLSNVPESAVENVKNIYTAFRHPIDTTKAVSNLALGGVKKAVRATGMTPTPGNENAESTFDAFTGMLKERYGGLENIKTTIKDDPVGFMSDLSTILSGVGAVGKLGTLSRIGKAIEPLSIVGKGVKAITPKVLTAEHIAQKLYESSLKMSTTLRIEERTARAVTGLNEAIMPTEKGLNKLRSKMDMVNSEIASVIDTAAKKGDTVSAVEIAKRLDDIKPFYENTLDPGPFLQELDDLKERFLSQRDNIPVGQAQEIKKNTYVLLRKHYGELKSINIEGQKNLARGIKEELVKKYPELSSLNANESAMIRLEESLERAISRITNRDIIGLGTPVKGAAGGALAGGSGILAGLTLGLIDTPVVKAALGIAINKGRQIKKIVPSAGLRQGAYQAGKIEKLSEDQGQTVSDP